MSIRRSVLLFSPFYYPENISTGRYNTHLAIALQRAGNDVAVVCSYPFYPDWRVRTSQFEELADIRAIRGGRHMRYPRSQILRRLLLELWYFYFSANAAQAIAGQNVDVIIDIYPPNLFSVPSIRRRKLKAPIVGIVHDLQGVMSQTRSSGLRRGVGKLIQPIEKRALRQCDRLIFLSNAMMQFGLENYGLDKEKCSVAYPFQSLSKNGNYKIPAAMSQHKMSLVYSGALSEKQAPEDLLALMDAFARRNRDYGVYIFSDGPIFQSLKAKYAASGSPVEFHGLVPDDELEGLLRASTIQIIPQKLSVSHGAFPSKLPNLIATGTSVFGITDKGSEVDHILSQYSRGKAVYSWDAHVTIRRLQDFADQTASEVDLKHADSDDAALRDLFRIDRLCDIIEKVGTTA